MRERFSEHLRSICNRSFDLNILTRQITLYKTSRSMAQSSAQAETLVTNSICEACSARLDRADYRHQPNFFKPCFTRVVIIRACGFNEVFVWRSSTASSKNRQRQGAGLRSMRKPGGDRGIKTVGVKWGTRPPFSPTVLLLYPSPLSPPQRPLLVRERSLFIAWGVRRILG